MLSPHKDNELQLMLSGLKRAAMFSMIQDPSLAAKVRQAFAPHVAANRILESVLTLEGDSISWLIYALPAHQWRLKLIELIVTDFANSRQGMLANFAMEDIDRMLGALLDYDQEDIDHFVAHSKR